MIKDALKFLKEQGIQPEERFVKVTDSEGMERIFSVNDTGIVNEIKPVINIAHHVLQLNTLTGLIGYIKANLERIDYPMFLQVYDEKTVHLLGLLEQNGDREKLVTANSIVPEFDYGNYMDVERLIVRMQANFVSSEVNPERSNDRELILKVVGNVKEENVRSTGDDGMSQAVTIRSGISNAEAALVPNPVTLIPYRTFLEVEQPSSEFIFRMKDGPRGALFEADGGAWRNKAILTVRDYLNNELSDEVANGRITIIA